MYVVDTMYKGTKASLQRAIQTDNIGRYIATDKKAKESRNVGDKLARKIETAIRKPIGWMDTPQWDELGPGNTEKPYFAGETRLLPELSWVQAGAFGEAIDINSLGEEVKMHATHLPVAQSAYVLRVKGDSMLAPPGSPITYPDGFLITIDPSLEAKDGDDVVVRRDSSNEATFKRIRMDGDKVFLVPLNPKYDPIEITERDDYHICGVVVFVGIETYR